VNASLSPDLLKEGTAASVANRQDGDRSSAIDFLRVRHIEFISTIASNDVQSNSAFNACVSAVHRLCSSLDEAAQNGASVPDMKAVCEEAISLHARSIFIKRLQEWPRGYQGDFETIQMLISQQLVTRGDACVLHLERYALGSMIAQQHRNKVAAQADLVLRACTRAQKAGRRPRVLSIACGGSEDLWMVSPVLAATGADVWINDVDHGALEYSERRLDREGISVNLVPGNAVRQVRTLSILEPFDIVVTGGLFDYLSNRHAGFIANIASNRLLRDDGVLVVTNLAPDNPFRHWIEVMANWNMNYREEREIDNYLDVQGIEAHRVIHDRDGSGLAIITQVTPPPRHCND
jgi:2-polyprenyl-3-methyl-5-hydroxy-6-metoxy-1,4-benzoquinol methylase